MISRREWLGLSLGAGTSLALTPALLRALQQPGGTLIRKAVPSTGEMLPAVGLSFSNHVGCSDPVALKAVLKAFSDNGGRVYDAMHGNAEAEVFHATVAKELGVQDKLFWSTRGVPPGPPQPGPATVKTHVATLLARLGVSRLDLVMLNPAGDPTHFAALQEEKKAGRVKYIGAQVISDNLYPQLEAAMINQPLDFIGVDYDVSNRARVEDTILPLARERKIGVMAFFPFGNAGGQSCTGSTTLFSRVGSRPLPAWAAEFDATSWAQFFIKYVISHPGVTVARVGTTKAAHMVDNIGGGMGRLPNDALRRRMAEFIDALPPAPAPATPQQQVPAGPVVAVSAVVLERYVGEYKATTGFSATFRREGTTLFVKPGANPEVALIARSETRFQDPRGPFFEFQVDAQGKVTAATLEMGPQRVALERK